MKIPDYLIEIHHAVETVVEEIYREQDALIKTRAELAALTAATADGYRRSEFLAMNPDLDDDGLGTAIHWDTYFGVDKDRYYKKAEYEDVAQRVAARQFSVAALSGSLLQYGKQGISLHYMRGHSDEVMSINRVQFCVGRLETERLAVSLKTDVEHIQSLREKYDDDD